MIKLFPDQARALDNAYSDIVHGEKVTMVAGAAGTGKTTVTKVLIQRLEEIGIPVIQAAPTGNAARQMFLKSGRPAVTLHRITYSHPFDGKDGEVYFAKREEGSLDPSKLVFAGNLPLDVVRGFLDLLKSMKRGGRKIVLLIDEASMVDVFLFRDLVEAITKDVLIVAVGDHCQLFPVNGPCAFKLWEATAKMEVVRRQGEGSKILNLATECRTDKRYVTSMMVQDHGLKMRNWTNVELAERLAAVHKAGQDFVCLTALNRTRVWLNGQARQFAGYPAMAAGPQVGERVIVLTNNYAVPCFNGQIGTVVAVDDKREAGGCGHLQWVYVDFGEGDGPQGMYVHVETWAQKMSDVDPGAIGKISKATRDALKENGQGKKSSKLVALAPALAITYHKSQGSQYPRGVVVMDSAWMRKDRWRGDYTAATRFVDHEPGKQPDVAFVPAL